MNEEIIIYMKEYFIKMPMPKKESLNREMLLEVQKQTLNKLNRQSVSEVLLWLKSNMNNDPRNGPKWLSNHSQQVYAKLWSLNKKMIDWDFFNKWIQSLSIDELDSLIISLDCEINRRDLN